MDKKLVHQLEESTELGREWDLAFLEMEVVHSYEISTCFIIEVAAERSKSAATGGARTNSKTRTDSRMLIVHLDRQNPRRQLHFVVGRLSFLWLCFR
jgi:hypothetical protein